jgi:hypothetical protein
VVFTGNRILKDDVERIAAARGTGSIFRDDHYDSIAAIMTVDVNGSY